jgi:hypothetical protein
MLGKLRTLAMAALAAAPVAFSLAACSEGPAERAGERIDRAVERTGDKIEDATDRRR